MTAPAPLRTYDESLLGIITLTSRDFARTWVRMLLRDRPEIDEGGVPLGAGQPTRPRKETWPEFSRTDQELNAALSLDALTVEVPAADGGVQVVTYYRPHITAARLYLGDPNLWKSRAVDGSSESRRDSMEIVGAWLAQGAGLDKLLPPELHPLPGLEVDVPSTVDEPYSPGIPLQIGGL